MNHVNADLLLTLLTLVVPLALALGAAMLGSYLLFTLPAWLKRWAHRRGFTRAPRPEAALATVRPLRAENRNLGEPIAGAHEEHNARRTA